MKNDAFDQWLNTTPENPDEWMSKGLKIALAALNMENAVISRVENRDYIIQQAECLSGCSFSRGDQFELSNTYCEAVIRQHKTISFSQAGNIPEMRLHPVYQSIHMESYIGTPIFNKENSVMGTLSFSAQGVRENSFSADEISFVEQMAKKLNQVFNQ